MATTLIIGRDGETRDLNVTTQHDGKKYRVTVSPKVPLSVSRQHLELTFGDDGTITAKNLNTENQTLVNGTPIVKKVVTKNDHIELSGECYPLNWNMLGKFMPKPVVTADIRPLENVWDEYQESLRKLKRENQHFNLLRSITGLFSMGAIALGIINGSGSPMQIVLYVLAFVLSLVFLILAWKKVDSSQDAIDKLGETFEGKYVCPNCKKFLGYQKYSLLKQNDKCSKCGAKFIS